MAHEVTTHIEKLRDTVASSLASIDTAILHKTLAEIAKQQAAAVDTSALQKAIAEVAKAQVAVVDTTGLEQAFAEAVQQQLAGGNQAQDLVQALGREWAAALQKQPIPDPDAPARACAAQSAGLLDAHG